MVVNRVDIEAMIQRYTEAEMAVLEGKTIRFNGQEMTMENLSEIRKGRQEWSVGSLLLFLIAAGDPVTDWRGLNEPFR